MWILLRYFGLAGLRRRIEAHLAMAAWLAAAVDADPDAERLAPTPFAMVCFRWRPARYQGREADGDVAATLDALNERLLAQLNESGDVFLSHTRLGGRFTLRLAINNVRTEQRHVERAWTLIRAHGRALDAEGS
jgi:aromatic-L-amino-acid decarboxylase